MMVLFKSNNEDFESKNDNLIQKVNELSCQKDGFAGECKKLNNVIGDSFITLFQNNCFQNSCYLFTGKHWTH